MWPTTMTMKTVTDGDDDRPTRQMRRVTDVDLDDEDNGKKKIMNNKDVVSALTRARQLALGYLAFILLNEAALLSGTGRTFFVLGCVVAGIN